MQYVYVIQSVKDKDLYIGCTKNLKERIRLHNAKKVESTKKRIPFKLIYYEAYINQDDAFSREKFLKNGWGRNQVRRLLSNFLNK